MQRDYQVQACNIVGVDKMSVEYIVADRVDTAGMDHMMDMVVAEVVDIVYSCLTVAVVIAANKIARSYKSPF